MTNCAGLLRAGSGPGAIWLRSKAIDRSPWSVGSNVGSPAGTGNVHGHRPAFGQIDVVVDELPPGIDEVGHVAAVVLVLFDPVNVLTGGQIRNHAGRGQSSGRWATKFRRRNWRPQSGRNRCRPLPRSDRRRCCRLR